MSVLTYEKIADCDRVPLNFNWHFLHNKADNLASSNLQDGDTKLLYFLKESSTRPYGFFFLNILSSMCSRVGWKIKKWTFQYAW